MRTRKPRMWIYAAIPLAVALPACLFGVLHMYGTRQLPHQPATGSSGYADAMEGDRLCRPGGGEWAESGKNAFLIVASATCSACQLTKLFDEEIFDYATSHGMAVYYILADKPQNREREAELASEKRNVLIMHSLQDLGLARVPTVARVDSSGVIQSRWSGTIMDGEHDAIFESLTRGRGIQGYARIPESEMKTFVQNRHAQVLAFSTLNRDPEVKSKIIPPAQVYVRARRELDPNVVTVVDCGSILSASVCQDASLNLAVAHFREVVVSGMPDRPANCPTIK